MLLVWVYILLWFLLKYACSNHVVCIGCRGSNREGVSVTNTPYVGSVCPPSIPAIVDSAGLTVECVPVPMSACPTCVDDDVST